MSSNEDLHREFLEKLDESAAKLQAPGLMRFYRIMFILVGLAFPVFGGLTFLVTQKAGCGAFLCAAAELWTNNAARLLWLPALLGSIIVYFGGLKRPATPAPKEAIDD